MIYFRSDYSLGAHPKVMAALQETNMEHTDGYGDDKFSHACADMIREMIGRPDAHVHFMVGGTPTNTITIASALRPYEGVISPGISMSMKPVLSKCTDIASLLRRPRTAS